jgi:Zn-dependent protease
MPDLSLQQILLRLAAWVIVSAAHGFVLALVARALGDRGPAYDGRVTINPAAHLDVIAVVPFVLFNTGWIKPVRIDASALRFGRAGLVAVVVAALALTLVLVPILLALRSVAASVMSDVGLATLVVLFLRGLQEMTILFVILNILPIPPLTGGHLLAAVAPKAHAVAERYGLIVRAAIIVGLFLGLSGLMRPVYEPIARVLGAG